MTLDGSCDILPQPTTPEETHSKDNSSDPKQQQEVNFFLFKCVPEEISKAFDHHFSRHSQQKSPKKMKCLIFAVLVVALMVENSAAAPKYQILEPREGYVPVYIRYGDEPLADINPALAAAFNEPVLRISRAELTKALQADDGVGANTSSNSTSHSASISASDEARAALRALVQKAAAAAAHP